MNQRKGVLQGLLAYIAWGLFPIFWKQMLVVESFQVIAHRVVWSFIMLIGVMILLTKTNRVQFPGLTGANLKIYSMAGILIGINWFLYVWAVNSGHIVESSLGYFINPLFNVLLGVVFFKERMRFWQWVPLGMAFAGVLYLSFALGSFPWIAITLAISFSFYGLLKKLAPLHPVQGLAVETSVLFLPALGFLIFRESEGLGSFTHLGFQIDGLLVATGIVTTFPLLLFASAARKIPLSIIGVLQYVSPTLQFLCGILIYKEEFSSGQFIGYGLVWLALLIFGFEGFRYHTIRGIGLKE
jgi:chloramphenicol-sensitive protein RarD